MSTAAAEKRRWTAEDYLAMERESRDKHQFVDGEVFAMAGASYEHNLIVANLVHALVAALGDKCRVFPSDMKIHVPATGDFVYPDASVLCGEPDFFDGKRDVIRNPEAIFEVLSDSTEKHDRGDKFAGYRSLPSHRDYVLVAQDKIMVEHFSRQPDGAWLLRELHAGQKLRLPCGEIAVNDLYRWVPQLAATSPQVPVTPDQVSGT